MILFPEIHKKAKSLDIPRVAFLVRKYFPVGPIGELAPDVWLLLEKMGVRHSEVAGHYSGFVALKDKEGRFDVAIGYPPHEKEHSLRFLVAHLVGHFFLHMQSQIPDHPKNSFGFKEVDSPMAHLLHSGASYQSREIEEKQADLFACHYLMPLPVVKFHLEKENDLQTLAQKMKVPNALLSYWTSLNKKNMPNMHKDQTPQPQTSSKQKPKKIFKEEVPEVGINNLTGMAKIRAIAQLLDKKPNLIDP